MSAECASVHPAELLAFDAAIRIPVVSTIEHAEHAALLVADYSAQCIAIRATFSGSIKPTDGVS